MNTPLHPARAHVQHEHVKIETYNGYTANRCQRRSSVCVPAQSGRESRSERATSDSIVDSNRSTEHEQRTDVGLTIIASCEPNSYIYIGGLPKPETSAVSGAETKVAVMQTTPYGVGVGCEKAPCSTGVRLL